MKKILFVICTHGDEQAGMELFYNNPYGMTESVEWKVIVGNPEAVSLNLRYIEEDLNRVCNTDSNSYEGNRAKLIKNIAKDFDVMYDVHTTSHIQQEINDCIFVNTLESKSDTKYIKSKHLIYDSKNNENYVTSLHPNGITLEYSKTKNVKLDRERIFEDFRSIINQKTVTTKKNLSEFHSIISQDTAKELNLIWTNFKQISDKDVKALSLPSGKYLPIFVNPQSSDPITYAVLNIAKSLT